MKGSVQEQAWRCLLELFFAQRDRFIAVGQELGLAPQQAIALKHLEPGRAMTMGELAQALHCDNSNVTGIVDRLEAAGLAERRPDERDRRVKTVVLTEHGRGVRAEVKRRAGQPPPELARLSDEDASALAALLRKALDSDG